MGLGWRRFGAANAARKDGVGGVLASTQTHFLSQGIDYLGFLNAKLRDLRGWATLLNELVQNADDPDDATRITLDVTDHGLVVENDGLFSDCGAIEQQRCGRDPVGDGRICCDFHAFRRVASGHKRQEEGTTGAFGIGFISVYQITDRPSLRSGRWLWTLRPEEDESRRIEAVSSDNYPGTRFEFPWAKTATPLRTRLGIEPVPGDVVDTMCDQLSNALLLAAPFLKRLQTLELRKRGKSIFVVSCMRDPDAGEILIDAGGVTRVWKRLDVSFDADAQQLRAKFRGQIEEKRSARVTVAVPLDGLVGSGRLYATLPTEHEIGLPILINADFYPSSDRKRILFDQEYQGDWNRAAIRAAATTVADSLPDLRDALGPVELWKLFQSIEGLHRAATEGKAEKVLASFWTSIQPKLKSGFFVLSSQEEWCSPDGIRLLQSAKDEAPLIPLLESIGQDVVHLDLQPFSTLLRAGDIGVHYLTLDDLSGLLAGAGLAQPVTLGEAPEWLRNPEHRRQLGSVIEKLYERVAKDTKQAAEVRLRACSLALSTDGRLAPLKQVRIADQETRDLFSPVCPADYWVSDDNPAELSRFVSPFTVRDAVLLLRSVQTAALEQAHAEDRKFASRLIGWFADRRHDVMSGGDLSELLRALPIWPSGNRLFKLPDLSVPGGFKDPLSLARILDPEIAETWHAFLVSDLLAKELTLDTYLIDQVPSVFDGGDGPGLEVRQSLMKLLIAHSGTLLDKGDVARALRQIPIVRCTDGKFRCGRHIYFKTDAVSQVLGTSVPIAAFSDESNQAAHSVLDWLGVRSVPDANDVLSAVEATIKDGPFKERRERIQEIFRGLAEHWGLFEDQTEDLDDLQRMAWLPSLNTASWHKPEELYAVFQDYLFASQGTFLDVPRSTQQKAGVLLNFLGIKIAPTVPLVAKHLIEMSGRGEPVNKQVYEFLNLHALSPAINLLAGKKCLCLDDRTYIEPAMAMWGAHRFGRFRVRLSPDWRQYQNLLKTLGVSDDEPSVADAVAVLRELSTDYADNRKLDDSDYEVLIQCWAVISERLETAQETWAEPLSERRVVANANHFLVRSKEVFFDDRPGLVDRFGKEFQRFVIRRPENAWRAMAIAGVRHLSEVVSSELVECVDHILDDELTRHIDQRWGLVRRIFATQGEAPTGDEMSSPPEISRCQRLAVVYRILNHPAPAEEVPVYLTDDKQTLFVCAGRKNIWIAVAKELAFSYFPSGGAGILASVIKDVLIEDDIEAATESLNELGISDVDFDSGSGAEGSEAGIGAVNVEDVEPENLKDEEKESTDASTENVANNPPDDEPSGDDPLEPKDTKHPPEPSDEPDDQDSRKRKKTGGSGTRKTRTGDRPNLRSYMGHGKDGDKKSGMSDEAAEQRDRTDRCGVDHVLAFERKQGRDPKAMPHEHEGYDIESRDASGVIVRYLEVKSTAGPWDGFGVGMSAPQFRKAQELREIFWLYVVEDAIGSEPKLHRIQDPANAVMEYRFDDGWQIVAETETVPGRRSLRDVVMAKRATDQVIPRTDDEVDDDELPEQSGAEVAS